ncbi:MAG: hypothetical protein ABFC92_03450 [Rectinema sp.]
MTREEAKKWGKEIQALAEGKTIQIHSHGPSWLDISDPSWNMDSEYRIKPESKLEPFDSSDTLLTLIVVRKSDGARFLITGQTQKYVLIINEWISYGDLLNSYEFLDGIPCGKAVDE